MQHTAHSRLVKWSLIIGIVIVMNMFFNYAISLVYKAPAYPSYPVYTSDKPDPVMEQQYQQKEQQFEVAQKQYDRSVFIILLILGVLSIIIGALLEHEVLSPAFSWGGVLSLLIASMRYWSDANNILKVLILAVALGALIWTAVKKFA